MDLNFCAGGNYQMGYCCDPSVSNAECGARDKINEKERDGINTHTSNKLDENEGSWCSEKNPLAPNEFKYIVCPNEEVCGDGGNKFIAPNMNGEVLRRDVEKQSKEIKFVLGDVCSWIIRPPQEMGSRDIMWVKVTKVSNT